MSRIEDDYEVLSDAARIWIGTVVYFWAGVVGILVVGALAGLIATAFSVHPVLSTLGAAALIVWLVKWIKRRFAQAQNESDGD